jgi:O-Antigen ligase
MTSTSSVLRSLLIYSICLPLAIFLGYVIAQEGNPIYSLTTYLGIVPILFCLALPLLLRWHHALLVATWNFGALLYFLPGRPDLWMVMAGVSLTISITQCTLDRHRFLKASSVTRPLLLLAAVVLVTALCRGGIGLAIFGSAVQGGKRYFMIFAAIIGYFAFISRPIPPKHATRYVLLFFLGTAAYAVGDLGSFLPQSFYFVYLLFPVSQHGFTSIMNGQVGPAVVIDRLSGVGMACSGAILALLARYGIREIIHSRHVFRCLLFLGLLSLTMLGGFRSLLVQFLLLFSVLFYLEGLMRSRLLPAFALMVILIGALLVGFVQRLPLTVQRTLSVLPLPVDPIAKAHAEASSEWRINIWKQVIPQIPRYLALGKGLGFSAKELQSYITVDPRSGLGDTLEAGTELVSDYHNGPLSVIVGFGLPGVIAFVWFLVASGKALYRNYRYGNPDYSNLNRFLFAFFISRTIFFFFVFGSLYSDLAMFAGLMGLSISLNGGIARPFVPLPANFKIRPGKLPQGFRRPLPAAVGMGHAS